MQLFVYGTLTDSEQAAALLDSFAYTGEVTLEGLHRVDGSYPTLAPGGSVDGRLLRTDGIATLDRYEGVEQGLYVRETVPLDTDHDADSAALYVGDPDKLDVAVSWPGTDPFDARVRGYLASNDVRVVAK